MFVLVFARPELGRVRPAFGAGRNRSLRERSTPYHLAHGLLDHAEYLSRHGDAAAAAAAVAEARDVARRLRCQPLLHRADALEGAQPLTHT